jgi:hypothetical protein
VWGAPRQLVYHAYFFKTEFFMKITVYREWKYPEKTLGRKISQGSSMGSMNISQMITIVQ